jgi:poly-gamma-glutamate capsule biosynthesis protein CapA/YwtB (metallophosphatase superfamily)
MLGREAGLALEKNGPEYPWGDTLRLLKSADVRMANLECSISEKGRPVPNKHFLFRAPISAIESLKAAGIDCVSLANNHSMDFGAGALHEMQMRLDSAGISHAGAGKNLRAAMEPALAESQGMKISLLSATDNTPLWKAGPDTPGVFYLPVWNPYPLSNLYNSIVKWPETSAMLRSATSQARSKSDIVVFSAHTGPNNIEKPSTVLQRFAFEAIKGSDIFYGHSAHAFQGISTHHGKPLLFDTGDFVDDYPHNSHLNTQWGFIYFVDFEGTKMKKLRLVPIEISDCQANLAKGGAAEKIFRRMGRLCSDMGTKTEIKEKELIILP